MEDFLPRFVYSTAQPTSLPAVTRVLGRLEVKMHAQDAGSEALCSLGPALGYGPLSMHVVVVVTGVSKHEARHVDLEKLVEWCSRRLSGLPRIFLVRALTRC